MPVGLYVPVPPPPIEPPVISLVRSAVDGLKQLRTTPSLSGADPDPDRWVSGISYQPLDNSDLQVFDPCDITDVETPQTPPGVVTWQPYALFADDTCDTLTFKTHDWVGRVTARMDVGIYKALEKEFWSGAIAQSSSNGNFYLNKIGSLNVGPTGSAVSVHKGMELIDQALASCGIGSRGFIHMPVSCLPYLTTVRRDGNLLLNARDTRVVPGEGYDGSGPGGSAPGSGNAWIYGTGPVRTWIDDRTDPKLGMVNGMKLVPDVSDLANLYQGLNRPVNTVVVRGEKIVLADWDTQCWFACLVTLDT